VGGKHYRRSSEKAYKSEHDILEKAKYMSTPSPTIPSVQSPWIAFLQEGQAYTYIGLNNDVHQSQYRTIAEQATMEAQIAGEAQANREAQNARDAPACSEPHTTREVQTARDTSGSKKSKRNHDALMDELISLRREELEAYKDLTERERQIKQRKLENSGPNNDPYSMEKCMANLKTLSLPRADHLKAIMFFK
jgi:hypothetical protein